MSEAVTKRDVNSALQVVKDLTKCPTFLKRIIRLIIYILYIYNIYIYYIYNIYIYIYNI